MSTTTCDLARSILRGDREQDLSTAESAELEAHLASCPACAEELSRAEAEVRALAPIRVPAHDWSRVDADLRAALASSRAGNEDPFHDAAPPPIAPAVVAIVSSRGPEAAIIKDESWRFRSRARGPGALIVFAAAAAVLAAIAFLGHGPEPEHRRDAPVEEREAMKIKTEERLDGRGVWVVDKATGKKFQLFLVDEKPYIEGADDADGGGK